jgi:hypothetical protein
MANSGDDGDISDEERLILEPLSRALGERYLTYAVSTISDRDARRALGQKVREGRRRTTGSSFPAIVIWAGNRPGLRSTPPRAPFAWG